MPRLSGITYVAFLALFFVPSAASTNFTQCLIDFTNSNATEGGTDYNGNPVADPKQAVALTYKACTELCGSGQEPFRLSVFSQQFSAWLLPWLALVSQLPFGAGGHIDNLISGESLQRVAVYSVNFLTVMHKSPLPLGLQPSLHSPSLLQPSTPAGPSTASHLSSTPTARALSRLLYTSNRFHYT